MPHATIVHCPRHRRDELQVSTEWNEKELIKSVPGSHWIADDKAWFTPLTWAALVTLRGVFGATFSYGDDVTRWAWNERERRVDPSLQLRALLDLPNDGTYDERLYGFQRAGVGWMTVVANGDEDEGGGVLGDEMGTGKTVHGLSHIARDYANRLPALVVTPNSVKRQWARQLKVWAPEANVYLLEKGVAGARKALKKAATDPRAIVIVNIEAVRLFTRLAPYGSVRLKRCRQCDKKWGDDIATSRCEVHPKEFNGFGFKLVIVDEAHRIKNPKSLQTRAIWYLGQEPTVRERWAFTGTPVVNRPDDLWSILHFVAPNQFPTRGDFVDRYCLVGWNVYGGQEIIGLRPDTRDEFFRILDPLFRRVLKAQVLPQLPPKLRQTRYVTMTTGQRKAYEGLESSLMTTTEDGELFVVPNHLVKSLRRMQFAAGTVFVDKVDPNDVSSWKVTIQEPCPKLDEFEQVLDELGMFTPGVERPPVVVAAEFLDLLYLAAQRLDKRNVPYGFITGDVNERDRDLALEQLASGAIKVLLFTSGAGGTGLDMFVADTLINLQRSWSPAIENQKENRVHRIGSERHDAVRIIDIVTEGTVEEKQIEKLLEKLMRLDEITRDRATADAAQLLALDEEEAAILRNVITEEGEEDE